MAEILTTQCSRVGSSARWVIWIGLIRVRARGLPGGFRREFGYVLADFFDFILASLGNHVPCDSLRGEHGGAKEKDFRFSSGSFATIKGLHRQLDQQMIGRFLACSGRFFDATPLLFGHSNGFRQCLGHVVFHSCRKMFQSIVPEHAKENSMFQMEASAS